MEQNMTLLDELNRLENALDKSEQSRLKSEMKVRKLLQQVDELRKESTGESSQLRAALNAMNQRNLKLEREKHENEKQLRDKEVDLIALTEQLRERKSRVSRVFKNSMNGEEEEVEEKKKKSNEMNQQKELVKLKREFEEMENKLLEKISYLEKERIKEAEEEGEKKKNDDNAPSLFDQLNMIIDDDDADDEEEEAKNEPIDNVDIENEEFNFSWATHVKLVSLIILVFLLLIAWNALSYNHYFILISFELNELRVPT